VIALEEGVAAWEGARPSPDGTILTAPALAAFFGLSGPGGFIALTGPAASLAGELALLLPGVRMALVNPPADLPDREEASVLRSPRFPLKTASMRGVALGGDNSDPEWLAAAARAVLPGLRLVGEGVPMPPGIVALGRTGEVWVGTCA
jgi:hypothetical protein